MRFEASRWLSKDVRCDDQSIKRRTRPGLDQDSTRTPMEDGAARREWRKQYGVGGEVVGVVGRYNHSSVRAGAGAVAVAVTATVTVTVTGWLQRRKQDTGQDGGRGMQIGLRDCNAGRLGSARREQERKKLTRGCWCWLLCSRGPRVPWTEPDPVLSSEAQSCCVLVPLLLLQAQGSGRVGRLATLFCSSHLYGVAFALGPWTVKRL